MVALFVCKKSVISNKIKPVTKIVNDVYQIITCIFRNFQKTKKLI